MILDALGEAAFDHRLLQALEQRDTGVERGFEIELAAHRRLGDGGDLRLDAGIVGQLVDAFDGDHGRIHVGDEQLLAPALRRLDDHVGGRERALQRGAGGIGREAEHDVGGKALRRASHARRA